MMTDGSTTSSAYLFEEEHPRLGLREFYAIDPTTQRTFARIELDEADDPSDLLDCLARRVSARRAASPLRLVG